MTFEAWDRDGTKPAPIYVEIFPIFQDPEMTPFERYMTKARKENTAFLTLTADKGHGVVRCRFRAIQDTWRFANMDIRESIQETHAYYARLWQDQIAGAADAVQEELAHLGREPVMRLLWESHVVQKYAADPARKEALYALAKSKEGEELAPGPLSALDILDLKTLEQLKTCERGKKPPAEGWNTVPEDNPACGEPGAGNKGGKSQ